MVKVLPPFLRPFPRKLDRSHSPDGLAYKAFRSCLRFEFGFTCAFCFLHEKDFYEHDISGSGLFWVEHFLLASEAPDKRHTYGNCFYSCRFCNSARATRPTVDAEGNKLLNVCRDVWSEHFQMIDDRMEPIERDADARYTVTAYNVNDPRKQEMRRNRRELIESCCKVLETCPNLIEGLLEQFENSGDFDCIRAAEQLSHHYFSAMKDMKRFFPIPPDAPHACRCQKGPSLPEVIEEQTLEIVS